MKFAFGIFVSLTLFLACTPKGVSPDIVKGIQNEGIMADSITQDYTNLKSDFQSMAKVLRVLPESAKKSIPDYGKFESEIFDYTEKMLVYESDLQEMSTLGQSFAAAVTEGKYDRTSAIAKFEDTTKERRRIQESIVTFKKELARLSAPYQNILQSLPNQGKDLMSAPDPNSKK